MSSTESNIEKTKTTEEKKIELNEELLIRIAPNGSFLRPDDAEIVKKQLGKKPRGLIAMGARCCCGKPAVTITSPRLPDGSPFPTFLYLCLPELIREVSRIEATGIMKEMTKEIKADPKALEAYKKAHTSYIARRNLLGYVPEIANVSAGGMPSHVKCLHSLVGYSLAAGKGVCLIGDKVLEMINWDTSVCHCEDK
ncbi:hypothetical protein PIROE2DRAFT_14212 [Piromyces sp. E2]|nr:hypothetical protein PIROE2DRAFT_14212 [Piromyces sp. E2]|eukprot:OUM60088.1 hypothetical protein PIROE2DRAFT_14212 [Piromyces sp. E2]